MNIRARFSARHALFGIPGIRHALPLAAAYPLRRQERPLSGFIHLPRGAPPSCRLSI